MTRHARIAASLLATLPAIPAAAQAPTATMLDERIKAYDWVRPQATSCAAW